SAQIREILINESAWEEMTCLFAPSLTEQGRSLPEYCASSLFITLMVFFMTPATAVNKFCQ
ncbi:hypothetical protein OIU12_18305, partial [Escherichia coli]|nr:hypothetical protein [Escherichia coli]